MKLRATISDGRVISASLFCNVRNIVVWDYSLEYYSSRIPFTITERFLDRRGVNKEIFSYLINGKKVIYNTFTKTPKGSIKEQFFENGMIRSRVMFDACGRFHNPHGPAKEIWHGNGIKQLEQYYLNGIMTNKTGPAYIKRSESGYLVRCKYYHNGDLINQSILADRIEASWTIKTLPFR